MTPAEFDTRRRALGLSVSETAALCGVNERTINRWSNHGPIPDDAAEALDDMEMRMKVMVDQLVETVAKRTMEGPAPLLRYRTQAELDASPHGDELPLGVHAILTSWAADALAAEGIEVRIEWA